MLVMGIGRHSPLDRLFGTETTLATLRESAVPVLAVGMNFPAAPMRVVVVGKFRTRGLTPRETPVEVEGVASAHRGRLT